MPMLSLDKALRDLPKTPVILNVVLQGVDQERAQSCTDGPTGWSVLEVLCHLNDYEAIFIERVGIALETDHGMLPGYDQVALAKEHRYAEQDFAEVFASYVNRRREFLALLRGLTPEQWQRQAVHPQAGLSSILEIAINAVGHDVNHIEQIIKALGSSPTLATL